MKTGVKTEASDSRLGAVASTATTLCTAKELHLQMPLSSVYVIGGAVSSFELGFPIESVELRRSAAEQPKTLAEQGGDLFTTVELKSANPSFIAVRYERRFETSQVLSRSPRHGGREKTKEGLRRQCRTPLPPLLH
ncbi:hypothetical protein U1Q18_027690 [Sarracenia purpurea var. burkii]